MAERTFFHVILDSYWEPLEFELPSVADVAPTFVAAMDRHLPRFSARHRRLGGRSRGSGPELSRGAALRGGAVRRPRPLTSMRKANDAILVRNAGSSSYTSRLSVGGVA
jgi:hypothetical protein